VPFFLQWIAFSVRAANKKYFLRVNLYPLTFSGGLYDRSPYFNGGSRVSFQDIELETIDIFLCDYLDVRETTAIIDFQKRKFFGISSCANPTANLYLRTDRSFSQNRSNSSTRNVGHQDFL
jgi:hypothetical protein